MLRALVVTGQNNHNWALMDQAIETYLEETGLFEVSFAKSPPRGGDMSGFEPNFSAYDVVISNYNGDYWPRPTQRSFADYVHGGGGFVLVHAADNAFPFWKAYVDMTGLGGWGYGDVVRDENWGPAVRWVGGKPEFFRGPGRTFHPPKHDFVVTIRDSEHPITRGMPDAWLHPFDEVYSRLRGPAKNMHILATSFADPDVKGASGFHEPSLFTVRYGEGRVFHTTLGHIDGDATELPEAVRCIGFIETFRRGTEWAATGDVTLPLPEHFPDRNDKLVREQWL